MAERFLVGSFSEPGGMLASVATLRGAGVVIHDVFAPYPVHGLDEAMGIRRSRLPFATLLAGLVGLSFALVFQYYTAVFDWPLDVGGKPENSTLAFVPICFELTVLIGGLATVGAFFLRARLFPGKAASLATAGVTDDVFALVVRKPDGVAAVRVARALLLAAGAQDVEERQAELLREGGQ